MDVKQRRFAAGITLTEAMVTMVSVAVAAMGGLSYEYLAAKHSRIAAAQTTATRTVQLLLEDWKSTGASTEYDPSALGLGFSMASNMPADLGVPTGLGSTLRNAVYSIEVDDLPMVVILKHKLVDRDAEGGVELRQLSVFVTFGELAGDQLVRSADWLLSIPPVTLATYARVDASGG